MEANNMPRYVGYPFVVSRMHPLSVGVAERR